MKNKDIQTIDDAIKLLKRLKESLGGPADDDRTPHRADWVPLMNTAHNGEVTDEIKAKWASWASDDAVEDPDDLDSESYVKLIAGLNKKIRSDFKKRYNSALSSLRSKKDVTVEDLILSAYDVGLFKNGDAVEEALEEYELDVLGGVANKTQMIEAFRDIHKEIWG